jgi:hypothetical protein
MNEKTEPGSLIVIEIKLALRKRIKIMVAKRKFFALFAAYLFVFCTSVTWSYATTIYAKSASYADVSSAIASSTYGDTVVVPAGSETWGSTLTIVKGITLKGAGIDSTIIHGNFGEDKSLILYDPDSTSVSTDEPFKVTGFTFDSDNTDTRHICVSHDGLTPITRVQIYSNKFLEAGDRAIIFMGHSWGVIYENIFTGNRKCFDSYADSDDTWDNFDLTGYPYGTANNLYFEDNTITTLENNPTSCGGGGRYILRFNTYTGGEVGLHPMFDAHGNQGGGIYACMGVEIYSNTISIGDKAINLLDHRGGKAVVFNNAITTTDKDYYLRVREEYDDSICPTINQQPQHSSDSYYWSNRINDSVKLVAHEGEDCCDAIAENSEFYNENSSFNGTSGMGVGTLANRPATCTKGVGYWATDQGSWNQQGADGVLYKCTSKDTWTLYYTPYTYPHPLRVESPDPQPPAAPTGLVIVN